MPRNATREKMQPDEFQKHFACSDSALGALVLYESLLRKWQNAVNLVSPTTLNHIWERHFRDSAQLLERLKDSDKIILDVGSGAGFPGMVVAILNPDLEVHLVESDQKKAEFLKTVSRETRTSVEIHRQRIEALSDSTEPDCITARAFAPLVKILNLSYPFVMNAPNKRLILPKGRYWQEECATAKEKFEFDCTVHKSHTDSEARILEVSGVKKLL